MNRSVKTTSFLLLMYRRQADDPVERWQFATPKKNREEWVQTKGRRGIDGKKTRHRWEGKAIDRTEKSATGVLSYSAYLTQCTREDYGNR